MKISHFTETPMIEFFFLLVMLAATASGGRSSFFDSWSREDMVKMAGYGEEKLSTVMISGSVLCEILPEDDSRQRLWPVQGASVAVQCRSERAGHDPTIATDEYGYFTIDLPSELHATSNLESECCVEVIALPMNSECSSAFMEKQKHLMLTSSRAGIRSYSAGEIRFQTTSEKSEDSSTKLSITGEEHEEQFSK